MFILMDHIVNKVLTIAIEKNMIFIIIFIILINLPLYSVIQAPHVFGIYLN
jgi:hypothetical protein